MSKQFNIKTIDVYQKGDLKGYANGYIEFDYNNRLHDHEFLYRFDDKANGDNWQIVSIDYGYEIPTINDVWEEIEREIKNIVVQKLLETA